MSKKWSIICCLYNSYPVVKRAVDSILKYWEDGAELILVDNHGPDVGRVRPYLVNEVLRPMREAVRIAVPNENLGCHGGWNHGYKLATGKYVLKFDDDTVVLTEGWLSKMQSALDDVKTLGYVSADIDAKQNNQYEMVGTHGHTLEVAAQGVVGFSCVMFRRSDIERWGPMKTGPYKFAGEPKVCVKERLYGGEEAYYADAARREGLIIAHYPAVKVHHLLNEERNPDYAFWKRVYGFYGWTDKDMEGWLSSGEAAEHYAAAVALEAKTHKPNDVLLRDWIKRLGLIGGKDCVEAIELAAINTRNGVVHDAIARSLEMIKERCGE